MLRAGMHTRRVCERSSHVCDVLHMTGFTLGRGYDVFHMAGVTLGRVCDADYMAGVTLGRGPLLRKTGKGSLPSLFSCSSRISTVSSSRK